MNRNEDKLSEVLSYLEKIIEDRKKSKNKSYTSDLLSQGIDRVSQKVGEEAIEVVIASNNKKKKQVIYESADLVFHLLVLWKKLNMCHFRTISFFVLTTKKNESRHRSDLLGLGSYRFPVNPRIGF